MVTYANEDLYGTAKKQNVELKRGDYVIVRTGMMERCQKAGSWDGYPGGDAPGFGLRNSTSSRIPSSQPWCYLGLQWKARTRSRKREHPTQPWHWITIPIMGMTMGEIFQLKGADGCAADKVYEFMFVAPAIPITGAVGSPVNPLCASNRSQRRGASWTADQYPSPTPRPNGRSCSHPSSYRSCASMARPRQLRA